MLQTDRLVRCKFVPQVLENKSTYVYTFILRSELTELIFILYESALKFFFFGKMIIWCWSCSKLWTGFGMEFLELV